MFPHSFGSQIKPKGYLKGFFFTLLTVSHGLHQRVKFTHHADCSVVVLHDSGLTLLAYEDHGN